MAMAAMAVLVDGEEDDLVLEVEDEDHLHLELDPLFHSFFLSLSLSFTIAVVCLSPLTPLVTDGNRPPATYVKTLTQLFLLDARGR